MTIAIDVPIILIFYVVVLILVADDKTAVHLDKKGSLELLRSLYHYFKPGLILESFYRLTTGFLMDLFRRKF